MSKPKGVGRFAMPLDTEENIKEDININSDNESNMDIDSNIDKKSNSDIDINNNIESNINIDSNIKEESKSEIKVNIKNNIKKAIKEKPEGYFTYLPKEYIQALEIIKKQTGFNKNELADMAYKLLFKSMGVEIKK